MEYTLFSNNHQQNFVSPIFDKETLKKSLYDPSLWSLLVSNFVTIFFAVKGNWDITTILSVYWVQTLIIGFFHHVESLAPKNHIISIKDNSDLADIWTYRVLSIFLTVMSFLGYLFTLFFLAIFIFLPSLNSISVTNFLSINFIVKNIINSFINFNFLTSIFIFFLNHLFSSLYHLFNQNEKQGFYVIPQSIYLRVLPMFIPITIISLSQPSIISYSLIPFLILKTITDCALHIIKHKKVAKL